MVQRAWRGDSWMTHHDTILYRCMCGNLYEDAGDQPYCPKCKSQQRKQVHTVPTDDDPEAKVRY